MPDYLGQQFGNYRLSRLLGEGGFAQVYLGEHIYLKTTAAIKVLLRNVSEDNLQDFLTEARTIAHLKHAQMVRVLEFGIENKVPFLVMTYAPHGTLRQRHPKGSIVELENVVSYVKQVASALQYVHDHNLIHRDVKPENMLLGRNNEVLLSDFGIAVTAHRSFSESMQKIVGTPLYMAPEQLQGKPRPASDQYALGIVVYEWLSGSPPFSGSGFMAIATAHMLTPPRPLREKVPALSAEIEKTVLKAIAKEPSERFPSIQAFADALTNASQTHIPPSISPAFSTTLLPLSPDLPSVTTFDQTSSTAISPSTSTNAVVSEGVTQQHYRLSRRTMVTVLASVTGLSGISGGIGWFMLKHAQDNVSKEHTASPTTVSTSPTTMPVSPTELPSHPVGTTLLAYSEHTDSITGLTWSPDGGSIASSSRDKIVHVWSVTGKQTLVYTNHTDSVLAVAWSPSGQYLASGGKDQTVRVWIAPSVQQSSPGKPGDTLLVYQDHNTDVSAIGWSPDSQHIASTGHAEMHSWDATTGKHAIYYPDAMQASPGSGKAAAWSPDGQYITSSIMTVAVWDATSGNRLLTYKESQSAWTVVYGLAWSPDGKRIACACENKKVLIWDVTQDTTLFTYTGHQDAVYAVAWSPDGKYLASASRDKTVQIWDLTTDKAIYTYREHTAAINAVIWAADSKHLASGGDDKTVLIWQGR